VFHRDVAKVDQNVAYVASVSEACCKRWFKMFYLFQTYVASVFLSGCCTCFARVCSKYFSPML
jgi:hypothetical protein